MSTTWIVATACNDLQYPANVDATGRPTGSNVGPLVHFDFEPSNCKESKFFDKSRFLSLSRSTETIICFRR